MRSPSLMRFAALRPRKPDAGFLGAAARRSPPRHAKRVSGTPSLRRKEMFLFEFYGTTSQPSIPLRQAQDHLVLTLKSCPDICLPVDAESFVMKRNSRVAGRTVRNHTLRKGSEGCGALALVGYRKAGKVAICPVTVPGNTAALHGRM